LYRYGITTLGLQQNSGSYKPLFFYADVTNCGVFDTPAAEPNYSGIYFNSTANTATIATKGTVALTLDSSQNATFAGSVSLKSDTGLKVTRSASDETLQIFGGTTFGISVTKTTGTFRPLAFYTSDSQRMIIAATGEITVSNNFTLSSGASLQLGNTYVAGAPTATGYVTIKDSAGNTYKVLVGT
jgi:hypothetical protein